MKLLISVSLTFAALLPAQTQRSVAGTVNDFRPGSLQIGIRPDDGAAMLFRISADTDVVRVSPGDRDLARAQPGRITDLALGDRILVSFVTGMTEARRIVLISADDIAKRNEAVKLDWEKRGISGIVAANHDGEVQLEIRSPAGTRTVAVTVDAKTAIRRYAPDSVKFADAQLTTSADIAVGDQFRARGDASADGTGLTAEEVVFGTFFTKLGAIVSVDREASRITIEDVATKQPLIVKINADSSVKLLPDMRAMFAGGPPPPPPPDQPTSKPGAFDMAKSLSQLPKGTIDDLKPGGAVVVTSTRSSRPGEVTAIMLLANADLFLQSARTFAGQGKNPLEGINRMHGGMLGGPGGIGLPGIIP